MEYKEIHSVHLPADNNGNYIPIFTELMGEAYGLGVFKQGEGYYFGTCNTGNKPFAFQVPKKVALRIAKHIETGNCDPPVAKLWGKDPLRILHNLF